MAIVFIRRPAHGKQVDVGVVFRSREQIVQIVHKFNNIYTFYVVTKSNRRLSLSTQLESHFCVDYYSV